MSLVYADRVKESTTTTGTGTISLGGTVTGYQTFVGGVGNGNTCAYLIDDGNGNWETTWGQVASGTPATITRGTLINSSTGSRISFTAGSKTVAIVPMAETLLWPSNNAALVETSIASATTTDLGTSQTFRVLVTGTTTITGFGAQPNALRFVRFGGALTLTHNASSLILLMGSSRTTVAGDVGIYISDGIGNWREVSYSGPGERSQGTVTLSDASGGATVTDLGSYYVRTGRDVTVFAYLSYGVGGSGTSSALTGLPFVVSARGHCSALGNTNQTSGLAFVPTLSSTSGGFSTLVGTPTAVTNSALNGTTLGFVLSYVT